MGGVCGVVMDRQSMCSLNIFLYRENFGFVDSGVTRSCLHLLHGDDCTAEKLDVGDSHITETTEYKVIDRFFVSQLSG